MNAIAMLMRCAAHSHKSGIYHELTEEERRGLVSVDVITPGSDYLRPDPYAGINPQHKPIDENDLIIERHMLGLPD